MTEFSSSCQVVLRKWDDVVSVGSVRPVTELCEQSFVVAHLSEQDEDVWTQAENRFYEGGVIFNTAVRLLL